MEIPLIQLRAGQRGVICFVEGGVGVARRLETMGLRPGKAVTKVSSQFMGGPVTVMVDGRYVAMGRGMAAKVVVEPELRGQTLL